LPLSGLAGNNPASCREKNTPIPETNYRKKKILIILKYYTAGLSQINIERG
jgi:hypothetical protein